MRLVMKEQDAGTRRPVQTTIRNHTATDLCMCVVLGRDVFLTAWIASTSTAGIQVNSAIGIGIRPPRYRRPIKRSCLNPVDVPDPQGAREGVWVKWPHRHTELPIS